MLPGMDGLTIVKKLRSENIQTPILVLTAKGLIQDKVDGLNTGADDFLTKPFSFEELLARIRAIVRRPQKILTTTLEIDTLSLDPVAYTVTRTGKNIPCSRKEFALLEYLMRNAGKILSKDQIISHVLDFEADILLNTVEATIRNLRNKIDRPFPKQKPLIQTVRGFGYKI